MMKPTAFSSPTDQLLTERGHPARHRSGPRAGRPRSIWFRSAVILLFLAAALLAQDAPPENFVTNGDFSKASADPAWADGWQKASNGLVTREQESDKYFIRLVSQQPGEYIEVSQVVPIPDGVKGLELMMRFRTSGIKFGASFVCDGRARFSFLAADGISVKPSPGDVIFDSHAKDWTEIRRQFLVPEGAVRLKVILCINKAASGTLDIGEVRLSTMNQADIDAIVMAPMLLAKKKAEDEEEIKRMLSLPPKTAEIKVSGNKLVTADGKEVWLQGVNVPSLEWSAKGENILQSMKVALVDWKANAVRLPVHDGFWFGTGKPPKVPPNDAEAYRKIVDDAVTMAASQGAYLILDLHRFWMPEERDIQFWKDAAARYKNNPAVIFDIFNEPGDRGWAIWRDGGEVKGKPKKGEPEPQAIQSVGMQALVNAVRGTGARNLIIAGGVGSAYDLQGILEGYALTDQSGNGIMYATHFYNWHRNWEKHFLPVAEKYPVFVGETGADINKMSFIPAKNQEDPYTWVPDALGMIQKYKLNWTAFSLHPKCTPVLISNWNYDPTPFWGVFVKDALGGKQFELKKMR